MEYTKEQVTELKDSILFKKRNVYEVMDDDEIEKMEAFCKGYVKYLDASKLLKKALHLRLPRVSVNIVLAME